MNWSSNIYSFTFKCLFVSNLEYIFLTFYGVNENMIEIVGMEIVRWELEVTAIYTFSVQNVSCFKDSTCKNLLPNF